MKRIASLIIGIMMFCLVCLGQSLRTPDAYYYRGLARQEKGDLDGAIADFNEAIKLYPKYSSAYGSRGAARKAKGDLEGAVADYNRAIEIDPNLALPYYYRGFVFLEKQDFDMRLRTSTKPSRYSRTWRSLCRIVPTLSEAKAIFQEPSRITQS